MTTFPIHPITSVLGKEAGLFAHHLDRLLPELNGTEYVFEDIGRFSNRPPHEMNRVYWTEILFRSHWAAAGAMIRTQRWLSGFRQSHAAHNLLSAAACARGLIEAAADAEHTLGAVPLSLAEDRARVIQAVEGRLIARFVNPGLEERLIHFTHASKPEKGESLPASHRALQAVEYRARLDKIEPKASECYRLLCDLTHPGASSVLAYAEALTPNATRVRFAIDAETTYLGQVRAALASIISSVLMLGLNPAFVTLKLLNAFPVEKVHTHGLDQLDLSDIPLWKKVRGLLEGAA